MTSSGVVRSCLALAVAILLVPVLIGCPGEKVTPGDAFVAEVPDAPVGMPDARVMTDDEAAAAKSMLRDEIRVRTKRLGERERADLDKVTTRAEWEQFRDQRLAALRKSLGGALAWADGKSASTTRPDTVEVTGRIAGDGYVIENLVIAGRPGLPITANLYLPDRKPGPARLAEPNARVAGPGILLITSHHNGKTQGELLDMGITWAKAGSSVLVMDNLGYNERRQHPDSFVPREDYRWRYYLGMQLYTVGESLMGWIVDDLHRGVDVLLDHAGADPRRIIVVGSVASGGDACAVLSAFDKRVTCSIPFNFGSPAYAGGGDYETTRCLRNSARDGFVPWLIVASQAPRPLIFAKEFGWDSTRDAGFANITRVFSLYGAGDRLDSVHGRGTGDADPTASPASNVGPIHRRGFNPILARWLDVPDPGSGKATTRPSYESLNCCLTPDAKKRFPQRKVHEIAAEIAARQIAAFRAKLAELPVTDTRSADEKCRIDLVAENWHRLLDDAFTAPLKLDVVRRQPTTAPEGCVAEKVLLSTDGGIKLPLLLIVPNNVAQPPAAANVAQPPPAVNVAQPPSAVNVAQPPSAVIRPPVVICVSQSGKKTFLARREKDITALLARGVAVCLVDVRGTGETDPPGGRYWVEPIVEIAAEELMTGRPLLGSRLRDMRAVCEFLSMNADLVDPTRLALWGESFGDVNPPDYVDPPLQTKLPNELAEPLGMHLALLTALFNPHVKAVLARGGLTSFESLMDGPACHVCLDDIVPGVLSTGDLADVAGVLAPRPVRIEAAVTGRNIRATDDRLKRDYASAVEAYKAAPGRFSVSSRQSDDAADWLAKSLAATEK